MIDESTGLVGIIQYDMRLAPEFCDALARGTLDSSNVLWLASSTPKDSRDVFMLKGTMQSVWPTLVDMVASEFTWSADRQGPVSPDDVDLRTLYLFNSFVCPRAICLRLARFFESRKRELIDM